MPESHAAAAIPQAEGEVGADVGPDCPAGVEIAECADQYGAVWGKGNEAVEDGIGPVGKVEVAPDLFPLCADIQVMQRD